MHVDLRTVSWRSVAAGLPGSNDAQSVPGKAQSLLARALEVHLGVSPREDAYGAPGAFATTVRSAAAASAPDTEAAAESAEPVEADGAADSVASETADLAPEASAAPTNGVVNFGVVQAGAGSLADYQPSFVDAQGAAVSLFDWDTAGADFTTADWARIDPDRIGLVRGDEVVYGRLHDLGGGTQAVEFDELVDNQGKRFGLTVLVYGAASPAAAPSSAPAESPAPQEDAAVAVMSLPDASERPPLASAVALVASMADSLQIEQQGQLQQLLLATLQNDLPAADLGRAGEDAGESGADDGAQAEASEDAPAEDAGAAQALAARLALRLWAAHDRAGTSVSGLDVSA